MFREQCIINSFWANILNVIKKQTRLTFVHNWDNLVTTLANVLRMFLASWVSISIQIHLNSNCSVGAGPQWPFLHSVLGTNLICSQMIYLCFCSLWMILSLPPQQRLIWLITALKALMGDIWDRLGHITPEQIEAKHLAKPKIATFVLQIIGLLIQPPVLFFIFTETPQCSERKDAK